MKIKCIKQNKLLLVLLFLKDFIQCKLTPLSSAGVDQQNPHKEKKYSANSIK